MPGTPFVRDGKLTFAAAPTGDSVPVGGDAWRQWLSAPGTTSFRFEDEDAAFTARREFRRGHVYWYAYRRRGPRLAKVYLGRSDEIDLGRLRAAGARLSGMASSGQGPGKSRAPALSIAVAGYLSRLPAPVTRLIGRDREIAAIGERLIADAARLVTLTGPGGTGKTRLAVEVASQSAEDFPDGVVFVDLTPLSQPDQVVPAIARALGLRDMGERSVRESVDEWLHPRRVLLLLDNFETSCPPRWSSPIFSPAARGSARW